MSTSDFVQERLEDQGKEDLIFLYDDGTYKDVLVGISRVGVTECTGEYFLCAGKRVWLKQITSSIPKFPFHVFAVLSESFTQEENKLYMKWKKHAE